jgi:glycosyltransferase involved in cell wall biosynthesis
MADNGSVLVVVPTLGERPTTLDPALSSVRNQVGVDCTLVVVVPAAATQARDIARNHGAVIIDDPKQGLSAAVNAGVRAATNEVFYAWIGDDDELRPQGLRLLADMLVKCPDAVVAYGACEYMDDENRVFAVSRAGHWAVRLLAWGPDLIPQPASLTRLDHMRAVGPYDQGLKYAMDLDMFLRLKRRGPFLSTKQVVAAYRWHPEALTVANRAKSISEAERIKRSHLASGLRPWARLWELPVRAAVHVVSRVLSARARKAAI